ncbi:hypothetical protein GOC13_07490 [Sinorhizobium meliloti]|nr:hypothetical protein [Sinorhizobium meliloti]
MSDSNRIELPEGIHEGCIVLRRDKGQNGFTGLVEHSFSMDWGADEVRFWWTGKAYSILGEHQLDGRKDAESQAKHYREKHPDSEFVVFDVRDPQLPVELDWSPYLKNREYGRSEDPKEQRRWSKHAARNVRMKMKE